MGIDLSKKALALANKKGQRFIKTWLLGTSWCCKKIIGIENVDYSHNWFLVIYEYVENGVRKVSSAAISGYWSGADSSFYGDCRHIAKVHAEDRMYKCFGKMYAHYDTGWYQCYRAKCIELNRKYQYEPRWKW